MTEKTVSLVPAIDLVKFVSSDRMMPHSRRIGIVPTRLLGGRDMPRILIGGGTIWYYEVDSTVGRNAPNNRADTLLVQFMLYVAWHHHSTWPIEPPSQVSSQLPVARSPAQSRVAGQTPAVPFQHPKPAGDIAIDGIVGPQTISFIEFFQESMVRGGVTCEVNGQIAPLRTINTFTLARLNNVVWKSLAAMPWYLRGQPGFPQELSSYLYI